MKEMHKAYLKNMQEKINQELSQLVQVTPETKRQRTVIEAMRYSLEAGGKRLRPVLVLEFCHIFGGLQYQAMASACAIEMIHTFSLIHDDLPEMDNDDFRRGKPSCHKAFGAAVALQAGDALAVAAFETIVKDATLAPKQRIQILKILMQAAGASGMIGGQILDMAYETRQDVTLEEQIVMCRAKTGALISAACRIGSIIAGAAYNYQELAAAYGEKLGLAFQLVDDILDVTGSAETLGKPIGSDAAEGKVTFVTLLGLKGAIEKAAQLTKEADQLLELMPQHEFLSDLTREMLIREN